MKQINIAEDGGQIKSGLAGRLEGEKEAVKFPFPLERPLPEKEKVKMSCPLQILAGPLLALPNAEN